MITKYDKILIGLVIILSISSIFISRKYLNSSNSKYLYIEVNGEKYKEILMDESLKKDFEIRTEYGFNKIRIENGTARVIEASCPDKLDIKQGKISRPGELIVCLPNKLIIEIRGKADEKNDELDFISH